jgi:hypothetical protein
MAGRPHVSSLRREHDDRPHHAFELGIEVAASIGVHLLERGFQVRCTQVADPELGIVPGSTVDGGYRMPGGDRVMLEDLARLDEPGRAVAHAGAAAAGRESRPRAREARAPGFAVLVDPDEQDAANLVALRPLFEPAVVFAAETTSRRVLDVLEEADWRIVRVRRPADIGDAWAGVAVTPRGGGSGGTGRDGGDGDRVPTGRDDAGDRDAGIDVFGQGAVPDAS